MGQVQPGWGQLLGGKNGVRSITLVGGVALHAINVYIVVTILPSLVKDIGGERYYSWAATLFVTASLIGAALVSKLLAKIGPRTAYILAALIFAIGTLGCGFSPTMPIFLGFRIIQGFGGGILLSLTYSMVRIVFERPLWPLAMGLISGVWGVSTLLGPAIGGIFAEYESWRWAFWLVSILAFLFTFLAYAVLPQRSQNLSANPIPILQLLLLTGLVLVISAGSAMESNFAKFAGLILGLAAFFILAIIDRRAKYHLLPEGAFSPSSQLFAIYILMLALSIAVNGAELYLPLFLQVLHGLSPLPAGYIAALMSIGWTAGTLPSATVRARRLPVLIKSTPFLCIIGMLALCWLVPTMQTSTGYLILVSLALFIVGVGAGSIWPHLLTRVLQSAKENDADLASASLTSVQLFSTALSAAISGTIVNFAGLTNPGGIVGTITAAQALFVVLIILMLLGMPYAWRISRSIKNDNATN